MLILVIPPAFVNPARYSPLAVEGDAPSSPQELPRSTLTIVIASPIPLQLCDETFANKGDRYNERVRMAITREVSRSIARCELTHLERVPIDLECARRQHREYEELLSALGCRLLRLPEAPDLPDAVFVEDIAVVLDETAVITRPGAVLRRAETLSVAAALRTYRPLAEIQPPGTLDGGDVLRLGRRLWVGLSARTNAEGFKQLRSIAAPLGYELSALPVRGCLHLKSAVTALDEETLLLNRSWLDAADLRNQRLLEIDPAEAYAANALPVGNTLIFPAAFPRTRERLEKAGYRIATTDLSELAKAEGAVTCCSLLFEF